MRTDRQESPRGGASKCMEFPRGIATWKYGKYSVRDFHGVYWRIEEIRATNELLVNLCQGIVHKSFRDFSGCSTI